MTEINKRKPVPVLFGDLKMYCEKMTFSSETVIFESPSVADTLVNTGKFRKMVRMTFVGRIHNKQRPLLLAGVICGRNGSTGNNIIYRDIKFPNCTITGFTAVDSGEDYIELTVHAATGSSLVILSGVEEE